MDKKTIFRGFYENKNGTKTIIINGAQIKGEWAYWNVFGKLTTFNGKEKLYKESGDNGGITYYYRVEQLNILKETIGQYTGETDTNGVKIFKDDIVTVKGFIDVVIFDCGCFCMENQCYNYEFTYQSFRDIKIIGNLWETPELIKE